MHVLRCSEQNKPTPTPQDVDARTMCRQEGIYMMLDDVRTTDRIVVIYHSGAAAVFWWMPSIKQVTAFDFGLFGERRFVPVKERLVIDVVPA